MSSAPLPVRVAVIGGGISGLAAAHRLQELAPEAAVRLFEAAPRLGGVIQTQQQGDLLIEGSADMFITRDPWALELCRRIGLADQLVGTRDARRRALVVRRGKLHAVPEGFTLMTPTQWWPVATTPLLSLRGKLRLAAEPFIPRRKSSADESLASFACRRLGKEAYERLVQPLIGGIYTADPQRLSMQATMRQFVDFERDFGSIVQGMRHQRSRTTDNARTSGARYDLFVAPRNGMATLIDRLAERLAPDVAQLNAAVNRLHRDDDGWQVQVAGQAAESFDAVIIATPAHAAAPLLAPTDSQLAQLLTDIPYASAAVVVSAYARHQIQHALNGFGFVVPQAEGRRILATSFSSNKFAGRAPDDQVLLRTFVGGACQAELLELADDELQQLVEDELAELIGATPPPTIAKVYRWSRAMPQYHVGHVQRVERIEQLIEQIPCFALAGNAYHGVGIPQCVHSGESAAERILAKLGKPSGAQPA